MRSRAPRAVAELFLVRCMKRCCCCVNVALVVILLVACTAKRQAGDLTVAELFKRGRELDGKHVAVIGYYVSGLEETCLWSTPEAASHFELLEDRIFPREIWVEPGWRRVSRLANRYVRKGEEGVGPHY